MGRPLSETEDHLMKPIRCAITSELFWVNPNESMQAAYDLFCPYCDLKLKANGKKFQHAPLPFRLCQIQSSRPGGRGQGIILTHGFTNNRQHKKDYRDWVISLRTIGWKGSLWGLWWDAGSPFAVWDALRGPVLLEPVRRKKDWDRAKKEASTIGRLFGQYLIHNPLPWTKKRLILIGHSLGAHVVCKALETAGKSKKFIADEVYLYGGAFPIRAPWSSIARGVRTVLHNHNSCNDYILKYLYPLAVKNVPEKA